MVGDKATPITSIKDKSLGDSKFLLHLCGSIEPRVINWDIVLTGDSDEDKQNNAKYVISIAKKLGAVLFCVWENILEVDGKQMLILLASLFEISEEINKSK
jgi:plastin-1